MVARGIDFPRTHALASLTELLGAEAQVFERPMLVDLDLWAVAGRYPEDLPEPLHNEASRLVDSARAVVATARSHLEGQPPGETQGSGERDSGTI
jgi:HEPN domain